MFFKRRILLISISLIGIDQVSKSLALNYLHSPVQVFGDFLRLHLVRNTGAAFSIANGASILLASFALAFFMLTIYMLSRLTNEKVNARWSVVGGLVIAGLIGNLGDRLFRYPGAFRGGVVDWIELPHWPIFNIADVSLFLAASYAVFLSLQGSKPIFTAPKVR